MHYASETKNHIVYEFYPASDKNPPTLNRLMFGVKNIDTILESLLPFLPVPPKKTSYGYLALDPEGRKVGLYQKK